MRLFLLIIVSFLCSLPYAQVPDSIQIMLGSNNDSIKFRGQLYLFDVYSNDLNKLQSQDSLLNTYRLSSGQICHKNLHLASIYLQESHYDKAIQVVLKTMSDNKHCPDHIEKLYNILGNAEYYLGNYTKALHAYRQGLSVAKKKKSPQLIGDAYLQIGSAHSNKRNIDSALYYDNKALKIYEKHDLKYDQAITRVNMAVAYSRKAELDSTNNTDFALDVLEQYKQAARLLEEIKDSATLVIVYSNMGTNYGDKEVYSTALEYLSKAYDISVVLQDKFMQRHTIGWIAQYQAELGNYRSAYESYLEYLKLNEEIINEEKVKAISEMEAKYENQKIAHENEILKQRNLVETKEKEILKREQKITKQKSKNKTIYLIASLIGLGLMIGLAYLFFNGKRKQVRANKKLQKAYSLIETQKEEIEEKSKNIEDSILYAKHLQQSMFPDRKIIESHFASPSIYFAPRDIVSGDFYWYTEKSGYGFLAVADCTGHGVPGAMVSMTCFNILENVVNDKGVLEPSDILTETHNGIIKNFKRNNNLSQANDGMDVTLVRINKTKTELVVAGAMNSLYHIKNNEIHEYMVSRRGIGGIAPRDFNFDQTVIAIDKGERFFMSSDGFQDQFGGPKGKKYKKKRFKDFLLTLYNVPTSEQEARLKNEMETWMQDYEQLDDILVIGFSS